MKRTRDSLEGGGGGIGFGSDAPSLNNAPVVTTADAPGMGNATNLASLATGPKQFITVNTLSADGTSVSIAQVAPSPTVGFVLATQANYVVGWEAAGTSGSFTAGEALRADPTTAAIASVPLPANAGVNQLLMRPDGGNVVYTDVATAGVWQQATTTGAITCGTVPVSMGGSNSTSVTANTVIVANGAATAMASLANGANNTYLGLVLGVPTWTNPPSELLYATFLVQTAEIKAFPVPVDPAASIQIVAGVPAQVLVVVRASAQFQYTAPAYDATTIYVSLFYGTGVGPATLSDPICVLMPATNMTGVADVTSYQGVNSMALLDSNFRGAGLYANIVDPGLGVAYTTGNSELRVTVAYFLA